MSSRGVRRASRGETGAGALRTTVATLVTVVAVAALAVLVPGQLPDLLGSQQEQATRQQPAEVDAESSVPEVRTADGGVYRFSEVQRSEPDQPVTYSSCEPIDVEVNLDDAPDPETDLQLVLDALDQMSAATGLDLRYTGSSDRRPDWSRGSFEISESEIEDPQPVLVAFATAGEVRELAGDVAGVGGSVLVEDDDGWRRYLTGEVTLDADGFADLEGEDDGDQVAGAIVLHELGHLVGLDHVDDPRELMYAETTDQRGLGPGDTEGLRRLGEGRC